jgi:hypothetical protein
VRLIIGRLGADPALLQPTPIPVMQAAQLLGVPPAACAVVASTPHSIRAARQAGARAIGYARTAAATGQLTAAGADATTASMTELAGAAHLAEQRRQYDRRHPGAPSLRTGPTGTWGARSPKPPASDEGP